ncbi:LOW QUALITY PROTEIN: Pentatricopeptide repeat [Dillenia turbinata]|uniref:Pentatricopeptide repeat n=1 Tax=Dillenia turbinata TaxID=194707 RepID=A0AAN8VGH6_9MAGN
MLAFQPPQTIQQPRHSGPLHSPKSNRVTVTLRPSIPSFTKSDNHPSIQLLCRRVFDETPNRTAYVWNGLFRALALVGLDQEALKLYSRMNRLKIPSDRFAYTYMIKACVAAESLVSLLDKGKEIHAHILRHGYEAHIHVMTTLVDMYAIYGCVGYASLCCKLVQLLLHWNRGICFIAIFWEGGRSNFPVFCSLLTLSPRCGNLELSHRVFDQMDKRDVVSWYSLISSYGVHGFGKKAIEIFEKMIRSGVSPGTISFCLGARSHKGLVEERKNMFKSMIKDHGIYPPAEHYACMVDLLDRANQFDEAVKIIQRASSRLFELEPMNAGNYVLLADTYAEAKMFDEVKGAPRSSGTAKSPGLKLDGSRGRYLCLLMSLTHR